MFSCQAGCGSESVIYRPLVVSAFLDSSAWCNPVPACGFLVYCTWGVVGCDNLLQKQSSTAVFGSMAAWRFGCGDCSWEWDLVTLGIIAAVLALVVMLICCAVAGDDDTPSGCFCFGVCLLLIFIILMGVGFGLGLYSSKQPYRPPKFMTIYNQQCWSKCTQEGATYFWCW